MPQKQQQESDENSYQPWREEDLNKLDKLKKAQIAGASDEDLKKQIRESYGLK